MKPTCFPASRALANLLPLLAAASPLHADTIAYWRFEGDGTTLPTNGAYVQDTNARAAIQAAGVPVPDLSGNGNRLVTWDDNGSGHVYRPTNVGAPYTAVPQTGNANGWFIENSGGFPASYTWSAQTAPTGVNLDTWTSTTWTIEASFYTDVLGGYRTVIGREGNGVAAEAGLAPLYFQKTAADLFRVLYVDAAGVPHEAIDTTVMAIGTWYHFAATCDGTTLKLYKKTGSTGSYTMVGSANVAGSANPALVNPGNDANGSPWGWAVGRGRYGTSDDPTQNHADRWDGGIDEIRISNVALEPAQFIASFSAADSDGDGLPTAWESEHGLDPNDNGLNPNNNGAVGNPVNGKDGDPDADGHKNLAEYTAGSDPQAQASVPGDIDADGLPDSWETTNFGGLAQGPLGDPDNDYAYNDEEYAGGTNPNARLSFPETEVPADGMPDAWETLHFGATTRDGTGDFDLDGVSDLQEYLANSNPADPASANHPNGDADADGLDDAWEVTYFGNVTAQGAAGNPDGDASSNLQEYQAMSDPTLASSTHTDVNGDGTTDIVAFIDFKATGASGIVDADQQTTGLVRLAGTGTNPAWLPSDPNVNLETTGNGSLSFLTQTTDINGQYNMANQVALGIPLSSLGFTGAQDFKVRVKFVDTPAMAGADQIGIFAGASGTQLIRGGRIGAKDGLGVNTNGNNDSDANFPGGKDSLVAGRAITAEISRVNGTWAMSVEGTNITPGVQPAFLNGLSDLTVGFFGLDLFTGDVHKTIKVESLTVVRMGAASGGGDADNDGMLDAWETAKLGGTGQSATDDPDKDGVSNLEEFAFNGNPQSGSSTGGVTSALADTNANGSRELTLTVPVRSGATFTTQGDGSQAATVAGVTYSVKGSVNLSALNSAVAWVSSAPSADPDYQLHTFRLTASEGLSGKGFLRAGVVKAGSP